MPALKTITTRGGARFTVAAEAAPKFEALLSGLEAAGVPIKGEQSGGYNDRNIAGTNTKSQHAFGNAVDVNWTDNPRGAPGKIPADIARKLSAENGFTWGGDWKNRDDMHFELARNAPRPMQARSLTAVAGVPSQQATADAVAAQPVPVSNTQVAAAEPAPAPTSFSDILRSLAPAEEPAATAPQPVQQSQLAALPDMPNSMRKPVDMTRLRQVLASRARLGTGVA